MCFASFGSGCIIATTTNGEDGRGQRRARSSARMPSMRTSAGSGLRVDADPAEMGMDPARLERLDRHFRRYVDDGRLPGWLVAVVGPRGGGPPPHPGGPRHAAGLP